MACFVDWLAVLCKSICIIPAHPLIMSISPLTRLELDKIIDMLPEAHTLAQLFYFLHLVATSCYQKSVIHGLLSLECLIVIKFRYRDGWLGDTQLTTFALLHPWELKFEVLIDLVQLFYLEAFFHFYDLLETLWLGLALLREGLDVTDWTLVLVRLGVYLVVVVGCGFDWLGV